MPAAGNTAARSSLRRPIRVLFACLGWPCGILDLASWIERLRLARACVFQVRPGRLFTLPPEVGELLGEGEASGELIEQFARHGLRLGGRLHLRSDADSRFAKAFLLSDEDHGLIYRLTTRAGGVVVEQPDQLDPTGLERHAPSDQLEEALAAVGRDFLRKLVDFRPHVVGFRVEAGDFERVRQWTAIVHRLCTAAVILGGPTATSHPRELLADSGADFVFAGDAEEPLAALLRAALAPNGRDLLPSIDGLAYRYGGQIFVNTLPADGYERTPLDDPPRDGQPRCAALRPQASAQVLQANTLDWNLLENFRTPFDSLYFTGGRGCPGRCAFCARLHGTTVRTKTARQLLDEIASADRLIVEGRLCAAQWDLFAHTAEPPTANRSLRWAAVYDEDFFLDRRRAIEFFDLWEQSDLRYRYRLSVQTNPCSLLHSGRPDADLFARIARLKPMVQLGAESFNDDVLRRWHKRHTSAQCEAVLDALDAAEMDYTCFVLLTDFDTTAAELIESLRLLALSALRHRRMRIASNPFTIPLYDSEIRRRLEYSGRLEGRIRHFTDYERPQPDWMDPLVAQLADAADAELQWGLELEHRDAALRAAVAAVVAQLSRQGPSARFLHAQAVAALDEVDQAWRTASLGRANKIG